MKLAFCLFKYFPFGGLQRDFLRIAKECLRRGHTIDVYTMSWEGEPLPGVTLHKIPIKGLQNYTRSKNFVNQVLPLLSAKSYDLILGFNKMPGLDVYFAADICFQARAKSQKGFWYRITPRYQNLLAFEKAIFQQQAKTEILLLSTLQKKEFMQHYHTPEKRFHLLPPGIEKNRIAPDNAADIRQSMRQAHHIHEDDFLLLLVGSGFKAKGVDRVLRGLSSLPEAIQQKTTLFILGKDQAKPFTKLARTLNISDRVKFLGGRHDVPEFLLAADLMVHPAYNENTGTVLLEAVAAGLPILTTDICGYAEYITRANAGIVLPSPFQQSQFNQALCNMLLSPDKKQWHDNAIAFAKQADIYSLPERAVDIIESLKATA